MMRILVHAKMPHEPFNTLVRNGTAPALLNKIMEDTKPLAVYFTEYGGKRGAMMIFDIAEPSQVPSIAEPFFLKFNADVEFHIVMSPEDLGQAGLEEISKKWA
jgi:hypothetical protein